MQTQPTVIDFDKFVGQRAVANVARLRKRLEFGAITSDLPTGVHAVLVKVGGSQVAYIASAALSDAEFHAAAYVSAIAAYGKPRVYVLDDEEKKRIGKDWDGLVDFFS
jgi:hypothetical protein